MPDRRTRRGPHPKDHELFADPALIALRAAVEELSWLRARDYAEPSALKLVGDRHQLASRQREAVRRSACTDRQRASRARREVAVADASRIGVDGFNLIITIESALAGGIVLIGRDGAYRDLASVHGSYRRVTDTERAIALVGRVAADAGVVELVWYLDRPVSNSGRLRALIEATLAPYPFGVVVELCADPDRLLATEHDVVASSDAHVMDGAPAWTALARRVIDDHIPDAWRVDLQAPPP
jgi:hypothetical protein